MSIFLIEQYSQIIQDIIQHVDDILRAVLSDDKLRQDIQNKWYPDEDNTDWNALLKAEAASYIFDPSIYPDNFFNK